MVFAYPDIAWDIRPAVMVALGGALGATFERRPEEPRMPSTRPPAATLPVRRDLGLADPA